MERVILILAMLAGLHLVLSFLHSAAGALKGLLIRTPRPAATPEPVQEKAAGWQQYSVPAYQRRQETDSGSAKNSEASFEVIA